MCKIRFGKPAEVFAEQIKLSQVHKFGHRFSNQAKQMALRQFYQSPAAYRSLKKEMILPSITTLRRMVEHIPTTPGFHDFTFLKMKSMNKLLLRDKCCTVSLDEMTVAQHLFYHNKQDKIIGFHDTGEERKNVAAGSVLVFLARGISSSWKQPLGYFNLSSACTAIQLKALAEQAISKLQDIGFHPKALINDQGLSKLGKALGISKENPIFIVNNVEIVYMLDTPHLLKSLRNNLLNYTFFLDNDKKASFDDIKYTYQYFKGKYSGVVHLNESHINPNKWEKMSVKLAAQVISTRVSTSIELLLKTNRIPTDATGTMELIQKFDQVFDMLNAQLLYHPKKFNTVYRGTVKQIEVLEKMIDYISKIRLMDTSCIEITDISEIVDEKKIPVIASYESKFKKWKNLKCNSVESIEFLDEFKSFFKKLKVLKKIKSRPNLTDKVNLCHAGQKITDLTLESILQKEDGNLYVDFRSFLNEISICKKIFDVTNKVQFLTGFITTIRATMILFQNIQPFGFEYMKTRRINQDGLENFFGSVRRRNGNCTHPTLRQFGTTYTQLSIIGLMDHGELFNCEDDGDVVLLGGDFMDGNFNIALSN